MVPECGREQKGRQPPAGAWLEEDTVSRVQTGWIESKRVSMVHELGGSEPGYGDSEADCGHGLHEPAVSGCDMPLCGSNAL